MELRFVIYETEKIHNTRLLKSCHLDINGHFARRTNLLKVYYATTEHREFFEAVALLVFC